MLKEESNLNAHLIKQEEPISGLPTLAKEEEMAVDTKTETVGKTLVKKQNQGIAGDTGLVKKFTELWFACYFERRLTKQRVENADLSEIVNDLINYFKSDKVDFRRAIPLL